MNILVNVHEIFVVIAYKMIWSHGHNCSEDYKYRHLRKEKVKNFQNNDRNNYTSKITVGQNSITALHIYMSR